MPCFIVINYLCYSRHYYSLFAANYVIRIFLDSTKLKILVGATVTKVQQP